MVNMQEENMAFVTTDGDASGGAALRVSYETQHLRGLKAISGYIGCSENTLKLYIRDHGFPATKVGGGWVSDSESIDRWRRNKIVGR